MAWASTLIHETMNITADMAASAVAETSVHLWSASPEGWAIRAGGAIAAVTGVPVAALNGVSTERVDADPGAVARLLDQVADTGLPYSLRLRPGVSPALAGLAAARGMIQGRESPLMVLQDPARLGPAQHVDGLKVRELAPEEAEPHVVVAAAAFEAPQELVRQLVESLLSVPGARLYLGEADGRPVTTGLGVTIGSFVVLLNIATMPKDRGRGYGAAISARAASDGLAAGASWSWLTSSAAGHGVYERLGYRTIESWQVWLRES
jgi:GNAT superfamily N-acetyltransferase